MAKIYANLIVKNEKSLDEIPETIKESVIKVLIEKGYSSLVASE